MKQEYYKELATRTNTDKLAYAWTDEKGVKFSRDRKCLYLAPSDLKEEYTVPMGTEVICPMAFYGSRGLKKVNLPEGVLAIGDFAFPKNVEPMDLPSTLEYLGDNALPYYKRFIFPESLREFSKWGIPQAEEYVGSKRIHTEGGFVFLDDVLKAYNGNDINVTVPNGVKVINGTFGRMKKLKSIAIPKSVQRIEGYAFSSCESLKEITIPDTVKAITGPAFVNCLMLRRVKLPSSLTFIQEGMFEDCKSLKGVTIPDGVKRIEPRAFKGSGLTEIEIPESVVLIEEEAFCNCRALKDIIAYGDPVVGKDAFKNCPGKMKKVKRKGEK